MTKTTSKTKGNRFEKVNYHISYYTKAFFDPDGELEEGEEKTNTKSNPTVKIPVRIEANGGDSRANMSSFEMKSITHFENNVENVIEGISQLQERVIKPKGIENPNEEIKVRLMLMQLICKSGPASQTLQESCRVARQFVYDEYLIHSNLDAPDEVQEDVLVNDEKSFFDFLEKFFNLIDFSVFEDTAAYTRFLYQEFNRALWNNLHSIIFGADAYRAFKQQKDYMMNKIVKPFGISVEAAFRRIEVMTNLMAYFPPPSSRGKPATKEQWDNFQEIKKISNNLKREMKYNLLPEVFNDRFDELETDWTEMSNTKFLAEAQKCETMDNKERLKQTKAREQLKRKKKNENDSTSNLNSSQKNRNENTKRARINTATTTAGKARLCELCKVAGAPEFIYTTHNTSACRKKDTYAQKLSSGAGPRQQVTRDYKASEKQLRRELKLITKINKIKGKSRGSKESKKGDDESMSSASSSGNISY
jgi:hypothetical protein